MTSIPHVLLNDGTDLPVVGLGTYGLSGDEGIDAIGAALRSGYRLIDSAVNYGNEGEVGAAVRLSGIDRDQLVVTTKLPGRDQGRGKVTASAHASIERLGLDRIDLYLIHWPNPRYDTYVDTWREMIDLRSEGVVRSIGVSNFTQAMLTRLIDDTGVVPAVNQVELHPYFSQAPLRAFHAQYGIRTESWSPLAVREELLREEAVIAVAAAHGVSPTQAVLRWHVQIESTPIPKSSSPERQRENIAIFEFALSADEMEALSSLERGRIAGRDPDTHEEM